MIIGWRVWRVWRVWGGRAGGECRGEGAVGAYETCHPDPNWRSLIMRGCPLVNGPVFAVM